MIVKVQISLQSSDNVRRMYIYNKGKTIEYQAEVTPEVWHIMKGRSKAFFHASLSDDKKIILGEEAQWQDW